MYDNSGTAFSWFSTYLTNRTQSVIVNDHISQVSRLSYGVPQGSVLGPILFILYTKPLSDLIQCHSIESQSFADDTQLQVSVPPSNIQSAISSLETCQTSTPGCWKTNLNLTMIKQRPSCAHLPNPFQSLNLIPSLSVALKSFSSARSHGFYIRHYMSVELHIKNVCRSAYS